MTAFMLGREGSCAGSIPTTTLTLSRSPSPALLTVLVLTGVAPTSSYA